MTLQTLLSTIQTAGANVTGIKYAPDYPPDSPGDFPFFVTYLDRFVVRLNTSEDVRALYDVRCELHVARKDLPEDVYTLLPYAETVANALISALLDNNYAFSGEVIGTFGALSWGDVQTIGFSWTIREVKVITAIT